LNPHSQSPGSLLAVAETTGQNGGAVTGVSEPVRGAGSTAVNDGREDLTVFFAIGIIVDVLLVTAFLLWAVGQWRKTKK